MKITTFKERGEPYMRLLEFLDRSKCSFLEDFGEEVIRCKASSKVTEDFPATDLNSTYFGKERQEFKYGLKPTEDTDFFKGKKLIVTRMWPIKAFVDSDTALCRGNFWIYTLKSSYPEEYLLLFESILNSKLAKFYLEAKYGLQEESNLMHLQYIRQFPIPDLESNHEIVDEIVETVRSKRADSSRTRQKKLQDDLDGLIFILYDLDYYDTKEIEQYNVGKDTSVRKRDMQKYCEEFIDTFNPFIKEEFFLNPEWATSESFGTMVRFSTSQNEKPLQYNKGLERFVHIIENRTEYDKKDIFKEKKITFYYNDELYIYKSSKLKDWTEFMAIKDANEELHMYFKKLERE